VNLVVLCRNSTARKSGSIAVVELEHAAEAFTTLNGPHSVLVGGSWHDELVVQRLVVPFLVVVFDVRGDDPSQVGLAERNDPAQAFVPYGTYESLGTPAMLPVSLRSTEHGARVQIGTPWGKFQCFHARGREDIREVLREHRGAASQDILESSRRKCVMPEITRLLASPVVSAGCRWSRSAVCDSPHS
jgi:hypothetical protein